MKRNTVMIMILMFGLIFTVELMAQGSKKALEEEVKGAIKPTITATDNRQEIKVVERKVKKQPEIEKSSKVRTERSNVPFGEWAKVEFLDEKGKVKKMLQESKYDFKTREERIITSSADNKYIAVVDNKSKKNTKEMLYKTGWAYDRKTEITIYNENGDIVTHKDGLSCVIVMLSADGKRFLCFKESPDTGADDTIITETIDPCKMANVSVYTIKGELLYRKTSGDIANICGFHSPKFSPSGNWIVVRTHDDKICVFGVDTKEQYVLADVDINDETRMHNYIGINDKGELEFWKFKDREVVGKYYYSPKERNLYDVIEE